MPRQVVIRMQDHYPFGECEQDPNAVKVVVRRRIDLTFADKQPLLEKIAYFRKLNQSSIVQLENMLEGDHKLELFYQYVPMRLDVYLDGMEERVIEGICRQLIELGQYLAKCYLYIPLRLENIGFDSHSRVKYFLDFTFVLDSTVNKNQLRVQYQESILEMLRPYLSHQPSPPQPRPNPPPIAIPKSTHRMRQNSLNMLTSSQKHIGLGRQQSPTARRLRQRADTIMSRQRKNESVSIQNGHVLDLVPTQRQRKQSILSSVSHVKIGRLGRRIDDIKNRLRTINSPEPTVIRHTEQSIETKSNKIAFNYGTTEKIVGARGNFDSSSFYKGIFRQLQQEETMMSQLEKGMIKQLAKGLPLKKNKTLKAKEYEQMKKSQDAYFKDFFQVLDDKPKTQAMLTYEEMPALKNQPEEVAQPRERGRDMGQLQSRVKNAINKSKNLINRFKTEK